MSASTSLHSAHLAEMVEISTFDYGFKVTTSSTEMAEIAEIDPLQLTEQGAAGDAATTITIMAGAVLPMQANSATRDEGPCWYDVEAALERHQANAGAIDVDIHQHVYTRSWSGNDSVTDARAMQFLKIHLHLAGPESGNHQRGLSPSRRAPRAPASAAACIIRKYKRSRAAASCFP